jgi:hypothetical protein
MRNEKHGAGGIGLDTLAVKPMRPPKATKCPNVFYHVVAKWYCGW